MDERTEAVQKMQDYIESNLEQGTGVEPDKNHCVPMLFRICGCFRG